MAAKKKSGPSWTSLSTAVGKATKVPALLQAMQASGPEAEAAMQKLASLLAVRGRAFDAAPVVVQLLAEQLDAWAGDRVHVVALVRYLVTLGEPGMRDHTGLALSRAELREKYEEPTAKSLVATITELSPRWRALLADEQPFVRAATAHLLGLLPGAAEENVAALAERWSQERDRGVRVSIVLAMGQLGRTAGATTDTVQKHLSGLDDAREDPLVRGVAAVMRAVLEGGVARCSEAALTDLFAAFALYRDIAYAQHRANEPERSPWVSRLLSWNGGSLDVLVMGLLTALDEAEARRVLARAMARALQRELPIGRISPARKEWPERVLRWYFAERKEPIVSADELTELQRGVLGELSVCQLAGSFELFGLPSEVRSRQRLLGTRPPGILERRGPAGAEPLWIALRNVQQEFIGATTTDDFETFVRARLPLELTSRDWLDLWAECETNAYLLSNYDEFPPLKSLARYDDEAIAEWADDWLRQVVRERSLRAISAYVFLTYLRTLPPEFELPAEYDDAFTFSSGFDVMTREVFAHFPALRREAIALRALSDPEDESTARLLKFPELAPKAAELLRALKPPTSNFFVPRPVHGDRWFCEHIEPYDQLRRLYQTKPVGV
jgi:hypothetical protein